MWPPREDCDGSNRHDVTQSQTAQLGQRTLLWLSRVRQPRMHTQGLEDRITEDQACGFEILVHLFFILK